MNLLQITGIIHHHPHYADLAEGRIIRFVIKHILNPHDWSDFMYITCHYEDPPAEWWLHPQLVKYAEVELRGPVRLQKYEKDGELKKGLLLKIQSLKITKIHDDFRDKTEKRR